MQFFIFSILTSFICRNVFILYNFKIKLRQVETQNYIRLFYFYYINYIFAGIVCSTYNFKFERGGNSNLQKNM